MRTASCCQTDSSAKKAAPARDVKVKWVKWDAMSLHKSCMGDRNGVCMSVSLSVCVCVFVCVCIDVTPGDITAFNRLRYWKGGGQLIVLCRAAGHAKRFDVTYGNGYNDDDDNDGTIGCCV